MTELQAQPSNVDEAAIFLEKHLVLSVDVGNREAQPPQAASEGGSARSILANEFYQRDSRQDGSEAAPAEQRAVRSDIPHATLEEQLAVVGLERQRLSELGRERLKLLAGVSEKLGLVTTDKRAVVAAVTFMRQQQWAAEDIKASIEAADEGVKAQIRVVRQKLEELETVSQHVEVRQANQARHSQDKEQRKLRLDLKSQNYSEELEQLEARLRANGFTPELSHDALTERSARLAARQAENEALRAKLAFYGDLPPDLDAARQVLAARQERLEAAAKQFEDGLSQL